MQGAGDTELIGHTPSLGQYLLYWRGQASKKAVVIRILGWGSTEKHQTSLKSEKPSWRKRHLSWDEWATGESQRKESRAGGIALVLFITVSLMPEAGAGMG